MIQMLYIPLSSIHIVFSLLAFYLESFTFSKYSPARGCSFTKIKQLSIFVGIRA